MSVNLESQLLSVMNVLVKAAVSEISQLFSESCAELRLHLTQSLRENDGLRTRMRLMRSEMFSLKLQNRTARPSSRCGPVRVNTPKPRSKVQPKPADSTPAVSQDQSIPVSEKSAIDEGPDIILIKDEDDEMTTSGHSFHNDKLGNTKGEEQKAANSQVQEAFINQSDFYNTSDPLAFSMPGMPTASHNLPPNDHMNVQSDFYAMSSTNQMESSPIIQSVVSLNQIMVPSGSECSSNSLVPKQKSDSKIFSCNLCQARFHTRNELNTHRVSHVGGSPITCTMCDKVFVSKNTLGIHMRIHTGEKPYVCLLCGKSFTQNGGLRIHLRTHSGEKPYSCSVCHTSFNNPSNLRRHKITHKTVMFPNVSL